MRRSEALPKLHTQTAALLHRNDLHSSKYFSSVKCRGITKHLGSASLSGDVR